VTAEGITAGEYFVGINPLRTPAITAAVDDGLPMTWGPNGSFSVPNPTGNGWTNVTGTGHANDYTRWTFNTATQSASNFANWNVRITPGTTGQFELFTTWVPFANNATNATYQIYEGTTLRGTVVVNQRNAPNDALFGTTLMESLGTYTRLSSSTTFFNVRLLTVGANGNLIADAVFDPYVADEVPPDEPPPADEPPADEPPPADGDVPPPSDGDVPPPEGELPPPGDGGGGGEGLSPMGWFAPQVDPAPALAAPEPPSYTDDLLKLFDNPTGGADTLIPLDDPAPAPEPVMVWLPPLDDGEDPLGIDP
jgi:hypothetical protein